MKDKKEKQPLKITDWILAISALITAIATLIEAIR